MTTPSTSNPWVTNCPHCIDGCVHGICQVCPCPYCTACRPCRECIAWIARLGSAMRLQLQIVADDRGCTIDQARADVLAAYHRYHLEATDD